MSRDEMHQSLKKKKNGQKYEFESELPGRQTIWFFS